VALTKESLLAISPHPQSSVDTDRINQRFHAVLNNSPAVVMNGMHHQWYAPPRMNIRPGYSHVSITSGEDPGKWGQIGSTAMLCR
jgi:hypothetical protein